MKSLDEREVEIYEAYRSVEGEFSLIDKAIPLIADQAKALKEKDETIKSILGTLKSANETNQAWVKKAQAMKAAEYIEELTDQVVNGLERVEELEKAIECATIMAWKEDELPDDKHMIMLIAADKVRQNLKKAYPLKIIEEAKQDNK